MNLPLHLLRLRATANEKGGASVQVVTRADCHAHKTIFRAPALPTPHQISNELPFTVNFRPRLRERP